MKKTKKILSIILAILMVVTMIPMAVLPASAAEGTTIDLSTLTQNLNFYDSKTYSLDGGTTKQSYEGSITLTGSTGYSVLFNDGTHDVIFNNVSIETKKTEVVYLKGQTKLNLTLQGDNLLKNKGGNYDSGWPALGMEGGDEMALTITAQSNGKLTANGGYGCAGIGGSFYGRYLIDISILGGTVVATGGGSSAGIGNGENGVASCKITISDATVTASSGQYGGAGIGLSKGYSTEASVTIKNSTVVANGHAAGIGCGYAGDGDTQVTSVSIEDSTITATGMGGAGIGGGKNGKIIDIAIKNSTVTASTDEAYASGIGSYNPIDSSWTEKGTITVVNSTVVASGGLFGAGIGGGDGSVTVQNSTVTASAGTYGAGIGGGYGVSNGLIVIEGSNINASGYQPIGAGQNGTNTVPTNTAGNVLTLTTVTLDNVTNDLPVTKVEGATGYNSVSLNTIEGKLYLYLPDGDSPSKVVANGNDYVGTVTDGAGIFTFSHTCEVGTKGTVADCNHLAICGTCLQNFGTIDITNHNIDNANWVQENEKHYHACLNGCGTHFDEAACSGGSVTCTEKAKCQYCGKSYGDEPIPHTHDKKGFCTVCGAYEPATDSNNDGYYEIANAGQLFWFANYINTVDRTANAVLTADIDLEGRPWTPIGSTGENSHNFRGVFDGQNHTIKGLYVEGGRAGLGFFGEVRTGTVKNFTIYGEVVANTDVNYVGGVIGSICGLNGENDLERNGAIIQNITSYVNLTAKTHGIGMIGGFVGYANHESLIEQCAWYGTFDADEYRVDSGAGGFVGRIYDTATVTIRNCGAYGDIITAYKSGTYNNQATIYIGGFLSYSPSGANTVLENNLWAGRIINNTNLTAANAHLSAYGTMNSSASKTNCYALEGTPYVTTNDENDGGITTVTAEQLKSGEIAYLLQQGNTVQIWGQMSNTEGSLPIITDNELYKVVTVGETGNYSVANVGDTNGDGTVDVNDYQVLVNAILNEDPEQEAVKQIESASYDDIVKYDLDGDGYLDVIDASLMHLFINGFTTVDVYAVGDYDLNGVAFEEADILAMADAITEAMGNPEALATYEKYACDLNADGIVSYDDLNTLTSMFPLYFAGEA